MTWIRLDDDMLDHPKWVRALRDGGSEALDVWLRLTSWCSRRLTDGVVPVDMIETVARLDRSKRRTRALRALVESGLCARRDDGALTIVDYLERNPRASEVRAERGRRAQAQRNRRLGQNVTGHAPDSVPERNEVPSQSRPVPSQSPESERARPPDVIDPPETRSSVRSSGVRPVPGLVVVAAQSRVMTMPGPEPPEDYLQRAVIENVRPAQARSTWKHYFAAGLPPGGIERLHEWLLEQARDYAVRKAAPPARASPGARPEPESEWDWRCLAQPHVSFAERHELDARAIAHRWYMTGAAKGLSATEADIAFAKHLKSLAAKPPPKRPSEPPPKEASA